MVVMSGPDEMVKTDIQDVSSFRVDSEIYYDGQQSSSKYTPLYTSTPFKKYKMDTPFYTVLVGCRVQARVLRGCSPGSDCKLKKIILSRKNLEGIWFGPRASQWSLISKSDLVI